MRKIQAVLFDADGPWAFLKLLYRPNEAHFAGTTLDVLEEANLSIANCVYDHCKRVGVYY